jgi:hypothetical protein
MVHCLTVRQCHGCIRDVSCDRGQETKSEVAVRVGARAVRVVLHARHVGRALLCQRQSSARLASGFLRMVKCAVLEAVGKWIVSPKAVDKEYYVRWKLKCACVINLLSNSMTLT